MKKFDTMGEDWTVTETGTGTDRKAEPEWAGRRSRNGPGDGTGTDRKPERKWAGSRSRNRNGPEAGT